jgi:hypothetical protein
LLRLYCGMKRHAARCYHMTGILQNNFTFSTGYM